VPDLTFPLVARGRIVGLAYGSMRSLRRGGGSDVAGSRPYVLGDDIDEIDWAASARLSSARGTDEFVVREEYAEEAPRVVIVSDRRPEMRLAVPGANAFRKDRAQRAAIDLIRASAIEAHGFVGYLDFGDGEGEPFWLPPATQSLWEYEDREDDGTSFDAPRANVADALEFLIAHPRSVPAGTFVFLLSDFLAPVPRETWLRAQEQRLDVIPVLLQDPVWERSFPPVDTFVMRVADARLRSEDIWLRPREVRARRRENEERWRALLAELADLGLEPIVVNAPDEQTLLEAFLGWAEEREAALGSAA
jgi:uncharacterized protein (DUF58 family)